MPRPLSFASGLFFVLIAAVESGKPLQWLRRWICAQSDKGTRLSWVPKWASVVTMLCTLEEICFLVPPCSTQHKMGRDWELQGVLSEKPQGWTYRTRCAMMRDKLSEAHLTGFCIG